MNKEQQKQLITEIMDLDAKDGLYEISDEEALRLAKEMNKQPMTFVPYEISDEEIDKEAFKYVYENKISNTHVVSFINAARWYREQLKQRQ